MEAKKRGRPSLASQEKEILAFFIDIAEHDDDDQTQLCEFLIHIGLNDTIIKETGGVVPAILQHYRAGRSYDLDLLIRDIVRWPHMGICELKRNEARKPK